MDQQSYRSYRLEALSLHPAKLLPFAYQQPFAIIVLEHNNVAWAPATKSDAGLLPKESLRLTLVEVKSVGSSRLVVGNGRVTRALLLLPILSNEYQQNNP